MPAGGLHAKVIETEKAAVAVILDDAIADVVEAKGDVPGGDDLIGPEVGGDVADELHQAGLPTAHGTGEQDALVRVDPELAAGPEIPDGVITEFEEHFPVFLENFKILSEDELALGFEKDEDLAEIIGDLFAVEMAEGIDRAAQGDLRGVGHSPCRFG